MSDSEDQLRKRIERQAARFRQARRERPTLLAQTVYVGVLGLLLVLPVVAGAYLGHWLDELCEGYSMLWTLSLIVTGVCVGAVNVYLFVQERDHGP
jgi:ATP synthase protein I